MRKCVILLVAVALAATAAVAEAAVKWRVVAKSTAQSELYASTRLFKKVQLARRARVALDATSPASVQGSVRCTNSSYETRQRSFKFTLKRGTRSVPVPLRVAECGYLVSAALAGGGRVTVTLSVYK